MARSIGYRPYFSGIGVNAECPNMLIQQRLNACIEKALRGNREEDPSHRPQPGWHYRALGSWQRPDDMASVTTLASPFRGTVTHRTVLQAAEAVRKHILREHGRRSCPPATPDDVLAIFSTHCAAMFQHPCWRPRSTLATMASWTGTIVLRETGMRFEVPGTHIGLSFNASAYTIIANRLAERSYAKSPRLHRGIPLRNCDVRSPESAFCAG